MSTKVINTITPGLTVAGAKRTNKFKALIGVGFDEGQALAKLGFAPATTDPRAEAIAALIKGGWTGPEAVRLLTENAAAEAAVVAPKPLTSKEVADAMVAEAGYIHIKGRVYGTGSTIEALVRVLKTGKPEIVQSSGVGRTSAVVISREASGDFSIQNLMTEV
jgi:hypothetical protein